MNPELLKKIPTQSHEEAEQLGRELVAGGAATVKELLDLVGNDFGDPDGAQAKSALHAMVIYAGRPGAASERQVVAEALAAELEGDRSDEAKAFICRQLQLCARPDEIPALAKLLNSERLCEPAAQALLAIGCPGALEEFERALPAAAGGRRATIQQAINVMSGK